MLLILYYTELQVQVAVTDLWIYGDRRSQEHSGFFAHRSGHTRVHNVRVKYGLQ